MILADAAQVADGKLYILGGGWSLTGPNPIPSALAIQLGIPWDQANVEHHLRVELLTADGHPAPSEEQPLTLEANLEAGRPAGLKRGTPLDAVFAVNIPPLPLAPGRRYEWRLSINGETEENWSCGFQVRPEPPPR